MFYDYIKQELADLYVRKSVTTNKQELMVINDAIACVQEELASYGEHYGSYNPEEEYDYAY